MQPRSDALEHALRRLAAGDPVPVAAPAVLEMTYGLQLRADVDLRFAGPLSWLAGILDDGTLTIVPFGRRAAFAAGLDVVTENRSDFERIGEVLAALYPTAPPLRVVDSPFG